MDLIFVRGYLCVRSVVSDGESDEIKLSRWERLRLYRFFCYVREFGFLFVRGGKLLKDCKWWKVGSDMIW